MPSVQLDPKIEEAIINLTVVLLQQTMRQGIIEIVVDRDLGYRFGITPGQLMQLATPGGYITIRSI